MPRESRRAPLRARAQGRAPKPDPGVSGVKTHSGVEDPVELVGRDQRVDDGRILHALERGLADPDARVARDTAALMLDRLLGRPTAVTETQLPGTQAHAELGRTLDLLPPEERLDYLREARMAAAIAAAPQLPVQEAERAVNPNPDPKPAPRALVQGERRTRGRGRPTIARVFAEVARSIVQT